MPGEEYGRERTEARAGGIAGGVAAVLFDFGGVLTTPVWDSFSAFCSAEGLDPGAIKDLFRADPEALALLRRLETGSVTEAEFERDFGERLGLSGREGLIDAMFEGMTPLDGMVAAVLSLRAGGIRTGLVSNSWSTGHYDREMLAAAFDSVVISAEVGLHKPQPEIYLLAAERVGAAPEACVFVDDLRENCEGAEAVGMTAIRHREPAETIVRLAELTGVALAAPA
jgi:putative hydrolase of the HAD superfamily